MSYPVTAGTASVRESLTLQHNTGTVSEFLTLQHNTVSHHYTTLSLGEKYFCNYQCQKIIGE